MRKIIFPSVVFIISLFAVLPLLNPSFFTVHDNTQVTRVFEMSNALSDGAFPVRWVENLGYGYGYPIFNFYAPLPYYVGGVSTLITDVLIGTKIMFAVGILLSGITMYYACKRFFGEVAAVVAAVVYVYFPYHALNIYVRGAVGEFFAYAFLPLVFFGAFLLIEKTRRKKPIKELYAPILLLAVGLALVGISHNLTLFMTAIILGILFCISLFVVRAKKVFIVGFAAAYLLGFSLAAFYVVPSFMEMDFTNVNSVIGGGSDYPDHFICVSQLWEGVWGFGGSTSGCLDGISFKLGKTNVLFIVGSLGLLLFWLVKRKRGIPILLGGISAALCIVSIFLMLPFSQFVWDSIPFMEYLQFPWRFMNFVALFAAFLIAFGIYSMQWLGKNAYQYVAGGIVIGATLFLNAKLFTPQGFNTNFINETNPSYIRYAVSKISDEYLPPLFQKPQSSDEVPREVFSFEGKGMGKLVDKTSQNITISYNVPQEETLYVNLAYFPSWKVYINGEEASFINTNKGIALEVFRGEGLVEIKNEGTLVENVSNVISLIAILGLIAGIIGILKKSKR